MHTHLYLRKMPFKFEWAPDEKRRDFGIAVNDTVLEALQQGNTIDEAYKRADENGEALSLVPVLVKTHADLVQRKKLCEGIVPLISTAGIDMREAFIAIGEASSMLAALSIICEWIKIVAQQKEALDRERGAFVEEYTKQQRDLAQQLQREVDAFQREVEQLRTQAKADRERIASLSSLADGYQMTEEGLREAVKKRDEELQRSEEALKSTEQTLLEKTKTLEELQQKQDDSAQNAQNAQQQRQRADTLAEECTGLRATVVELRGKLEKATQERDVAYASFRNGNSSASSSSSGGGGAKTEELEARLRQTAEQMRMLEKRVVLAENAARETNTQLVRLNGELVAGTMMRREAQTKAATAPPSPSPSVLLQQQQQQQQPPSPRRNFTATTNTKPPRRSSHHVSAGVGGRAHKSGGCTCGWCN